MAEENGQQYRDGYRLPLRLGRLEFQIPRPFHRRRVEGGEARRFSDARRIGNDRTVPVDEDAERHVALDFLGVERRWIPKRQLLVEHHRRDIRLPPDSLKREVGSIPFFASGHAQYQQDASRTNSRHVHVQAGPPSRLTSSTSRATSSSAWIGVIVLGSTFLSCCTTGCVCTPKSPN